MSEIIFVMKLFEYSEKKNGKKKLEQREEMKINFINLLGLRGEGNNFRRFYSVKLKKIE